MRDRASVQKCIYFTEDMVDEITTAAKQLKVPFTEIVRECVSNDLPKLIEREIKRRKSRTNRRQSSIET